MRSVEMDLTLKHIHAMMETTLTLMVVIPIVRLKMHLTAKGETLLVGMSVSRSLFVPLSRYHQSP